MLPPMVKQAAFNSGDLSLWQERQEKKVALLRREINAAQPPTFNRAQGKSRPAQHAPNTIQFPRQGSPLMVRDGPSLNEMVPNLVRQ